MSEPILNVGERNRAQRVGKSLQQGLPSARLGLSQGRLDLRPAQFNRVEVRRIRRQELHPCALGFNQLTDGLPGMSRQVIQDHNIAAVQGREQLRTHIGFKGHAIHGTFKYPRRCDFLPAQCGHQGVMGTGIPGRGFDDPLARCRSTVQTGQAQMSPTFIDEFQAFHQRSQGVYELYLVVLPQGFYARRLTLAVVERLFLRGNFKIFSSRHIMLRLATTPVAFWTRSHNASSVRSGCFLTSSRINFSAACRVRLGPEAGGKAAQLPVSRKRYHHFSKVDLWIWNCAATSAWVFPASKAAIARSRKSWEYGFMARSLPDFSRKSRRNSI